MAPAPTVAPAPEPSVEPAPAAPSPPVSPSEPAAAAGPAAPDPAPAVPAGGAVDVARMAAALDAVLPNLRAPAKAACQDGAFVTADESTAVFELGMGVPLRHAERFRVDIEAALREQLGQQISLQLIPSGDAADHAAPRISGGAVDIAEVEADEAEQARTIDITELEDANDVAETGIDRLTKAFPGAVVVDPDEVTT